MSDVIRNYRAMFRHATGYDTALTDVTIVAIVDEHHGVMTDDNALADDYREQLRTISNPYDQTIVSIMIERDTSEAKPKAVIAPPPPLTMAHRWFKVDYRVHAASEHVFTCEVHCYPTSVGLWHACIPDNAHGTPNRSMLCAIASTLNANEFDYINLFEIDRAGNRIA
jgi:hypothetical protein